MPRQYGTAAMPPRSGWLRPIDRASDHHHPGRRNTQTRNYRSPVWNCECLCGRLVQVLGTNLLNRRSKSCGCFRRYQAAAKAVIRGDNPDIQGLLSSLVQRLAHCIEDGREIDRMPFLVRGGR
jgi:hypothetical protein